MSKRVVAQVKRDYNNHDEFVQSRRVHRRRRPGRTALRAHPCSSFPATLQRSPTRSHDARYAQGIHACKICVRSFAFQACQGKQEQSRRRGRSGTRGRFPDLQRSSIQSTLKLPPVFQALPPDAAARRRRQPRHQRLELNVGAIISLHL